MNQINELIVEITHNCNLKCKMCGYGQAKSSPDKNMNFSLFKKVIDEIGPFSKTIRLNGRGESTIHPEFIEMLDYARNQQPKAQLSLFTNFSFDNGRIIQRMIESDLQLFLSIDSPFREELEEIRRGCNYDWIMNNIDQISQLKRRPFLVFTIMEDNINRIFDIGEFCAENRLNIIYNTVRRDEGIQPFIDEVIKNKVQIEKDFTKVSDLFDKTNLNAFYPNQISGIRINCSGITVTNNDKKRCPALDNELCILYNGDVTPCNMFNPYVYGNLLVENIDEILNGSKRREFVENYKDNYYCRNCACLGEII